MRCLVPIALLAAACAPGLPQPGPDGLDPAWGWNGEPTDVVITGSRFYPRLQAAGGEDVELDRQFRAWIEGPERVSLSDVSFRSDEELRARVPSGALPGIYDLVVEGPSGESGRLDGAFTVTDNRADHLELAATDVSWPVNTPARLDIALADPAGLGVPEPIAVEVSVRGMDSPSQIRFEDSLDGQEVFVDVEAGLFGVTGALGPDGRGYVTFTSNVPAELWLDVAPVDPDSVIAGASQFMVFRPADAVSVEIEPIDDGPIVAGEPFDLRVRLLDGLGNVATDSSAGLTLFETCGTRVGRFSSELIVAGSTVVRDVVLHGATPSGGGTTCDENRIEAIGNALGTTITGETEALAVAPGVAAGFEVDAWPTTLEAGVDTAFVDVFAEDAVGNRVPWHDTELTLSDSLGGLSWGEEAWSCGPFDAGRARCVAQPTTAGADITLRVAGEDGLAGRFEGLQVRATTPASLAVSGPTAAIAAGSGFTVDLRATDRWGNGVPLDINGVDQPVFSDAGGPLGCLWQGSLAPLGTERFGCTATLADADAVVVAAVPIRALLGLSAPFEVTNGALASVVFSSLPASTTAGDGVLVGVQAADAWGNAYTVQAVSAVQIWDESGDIAGQVVSLGTTGGGSTTIAPTTAWVANQLTARDGAAELGRSASFDVEPDVAVSLDVAITETWAWVDDDVSVELTAVDAFGNTVQGYAETVTLSSAGDAGEAVTVSGFSSGVAETRFAFDAPQIQDRLVADDGDLTGMSGAIDVIEECSDGPAAALTLGGSEELVLCRTGGTTPSATLSTAGSTAGAAPILATHFAATPDDWTRVAGTSMATTWDQTGTWAVDAVVVDEDACGALASAVLWVADDDGEAAGPVEVSPASASLVAGSATQGDTAVQISATDCAGDPAAGGLLHARATLGVLLSGSSTLFSTGDGLAFNLDGSGEANLTWSVQGDRHAGTPTLHVGRPTEESYGAAEVVVTGDAALPVVVDVAPVGTSSATFSEVSVDFSEPMLTGSVSASSAALFDPLGANPSVVRSLSADRQTLTLTLAAPRDAGSGVWTLALGSNLRDLSGNRLDGQYSGTSGALSLDFGAVADIAPDVLSCSASVGSFHPDGDAGAGSAADEVSLNATAGVPPAWWELEVTDAAGDLLYLHRVAGVAGTTALSWDGRGFDGMVLDNQTVTLTVTGLDTSWNPGQSCSAEVTIANRVQPPEHQR